MPEATKSSIKTDVQNLLARHTKNVADYRAGQKVTEAEFRNVREQAAALASAIAGAPGSDLSADESEAIDRLFAISDVCKHYEGIAPRGRKTDPADPGSTGAGRLANRQGDGGGDRFVDVRNGREIAMLAREDSLASFYASAPAGYDLGAQVQGERDVPRFGDVVRALATGDHTGININAALTGGQDSAGGYMIAPRISAEVLDHARTRSVVVQAGARTVPMPSRELVFAAIENYPAMSVVDEGGDIPVDTAMSLGAYRMVANKIATVVPVSQELLADAPNAGRVIRDALGEAAAAEIDRIALLGEGTIAGLFSEDRVSENPIGGAVSWSVFLDSAAAVETANGEAKSIIYSPAVKLSLAKLTINSEANNWASPPPTLASLPKFVSNKIGSDKAAIGDFSQIALGMLGGVNIAVTSQGTLKTGEGFGRDQVLLRLTLRFDVLILRGSWMEKLTGIA